MAAPPAMEGTWRRTAGCAAPPGQVVPDRPHPREPAHEHQLADVVRLMVEGQECGTGVRVVTAPGDSRRGIAMLERQRLQPRVGQERQYSGGA